MEIQGFLGGDDKQYFIEGEDGTEVRARIPSKNAELKKKVAEYIENCEYLTFQGDMVSGEFTIHEMKSVYEDSGEE